MTLPGEDRSVVTALRDDEPAVAEEAALGDWIVRRAGGDYYPCTPAVVEARHASVE